MADSLGSFTVTLDTVKVTCIADPEKPDADLEPAFSGSYQSLDSTKALARRDVPLYLRDFRRGSHFVRRTSELDDGGLAWCEDGISWLRNGLVPSGRRQAKGLGLGLGYTTNVEVVGSAYFAGDVWALLNNGKILKYTGADPSVTPTEHPPSGAAFNGGSTGFRSGYTPYSLAVFSTRLDGAGAYSAGGTVHAALYVYCIGPAGVWRVYQYTTAFGWVESGLLGMGGLHAAVCFWEGSNGVGAERLHINTDGSIMRHCIQGNNPLDPASYVTPITVGNQAYVIKSLAASPGHLYVIKENGIHDINELRTWNVTPYWERTVSANQGLVSAIYNDHLYAVRNMEVDRFDLNLGEGVQQRLPGACGPGAYMQDGTPIRGQIDAWADHDGWLIGALFNPDKKTTYIGRGKAKRSSSEEIENPLSWHFAEQVLPPIDVTKSVRCKVMRVVPAAPTSGLPSGTAMLWMWVVIGFEHGTYDVDLYYAPLPSGSGPISLQASGGSFPFNPTARFFFTEQNWDDENATAAIRRVDVRGLNVSATRTIEIRSRTGQPPATITDQSTWTSLGTATADSTAIIPSTAVEGKGVAFQAVLTTPSPYTTTPVFVALSPRAKVIRETAQVIFLNVLLEKGAELKLGQQDLRKVSTLAGQIAALQDRGSIPYTDEEGGEWRCMVEQGMQIFRQQVEDEWRTILRVEVSLLRAA